MQYTAYFVYAKRLVSDATLVSPESTSMPGAPLLRISAKEFSEYMPLGPALKAAQVTIALLFPSTLTSTRAASFSGVTDTMDTFTETGTTKASGTSTALGSAEGLAKGCELGWAVG